MVEKCSFLLSHPHEESLSDFPSICYAKLKHNSRLQGLRRNPLTTENIDLSMVKTPRSFCLSEQRLVLQPLSHIKQ